MRASVGSEDEELANGVGSLSTDKDSKIPISGDGRYVAFSSPNPATDDPDFGFAVDTDVFVRDLKKGKTIRASLKSNGEEADPNDNANSRTPSISEDGRYVAFEADGFAKFARRRRQQRDRHLRARRRRRRRRSASASSRTATSRRSAAWPRRSPRSQRTGATSSGTRSGTSGRTAATCGNVYRHDVKSGKTILVSPASNGDVTDTNQLGDVANKDWVAFSSMAQEHEHGRRRERLRRLPARPARLARRPANRR